MKRYCLSILLLLTSIIILVGQDKRPVLIGLQPAMTKEKFYEEDEFDINVLPLVIQVPINKRMDLRYVNLLNYHFNGNKGISDIGGELCIPIFIKKKLETNQTSGGIYLGPLVAMGRNLKNLHYTLTPAIDTGYLFHTHKRFAVSIGVQVGGSYFLYDDLDPKWRNHFGFKANFGFWINSNK